VAVLASALLLAIALPFPVSAASNGPCADGNVVNRFDGYTKIVAAVVSAEAQIEGQPPALCAGPDGDSGSFTWIGVQVNGSQRSIYQMGVAKCSYPYSICSGGYRIFYSWGRDDSQGTCTSDVDPVPLDLGAAPIGLHTYTVVRTATLIKFQLDGATIHDIPLSWVSCWTANSVAWVAETWDRGDQAGGTVADHQKVRAALYEASVGGVWSNASFPIGCNNTIPTLSDYLCSRINGTGVDLWTDKS
jgi:hypothetical protein